MTVTIMAMASAIDIIITTIVTTTAAIIIKNGTGTRMTESCRVRFLAESPFLLLDPC